ncbi:ion channel TACAN isoform X3 [Brachionichthys hirsutus]|uniref:ion channel TACAN isoform X3 n=1 Tax=Brachionichthys hirsutus TaxID=412623 RepID=UPI003604A32A
MLSSPAGLAECLREWEDLEKNHRQLLDTHRLYKQKLEEVTRLQDGCSGAVARHRKQLRELSAALKECQEHHPTPKGMGAIAEVRESVKDRMTSCAEMEAFLPKKNGLYLSLVLGNVNVTLLNKQSKFAYKDEYEKFKLVLMVILFLFSFTCRFLFRYRVLDALFYFLLVWYYCTLTIRESVLISNGSRIKGWWVFHHYVSTFLSGVMLTWPEGVLYQMFREQFLTYSLYQSKRFQLQTTLMGYIVLRPVPAVLLPERLLVPAPSAGGATQHGPDSGGFPVLDVERPDLPPSFPLLWALLAALQQRDSLEDVAAAGV